MRPPRLLIPQVFPEGVYHAVSRVNGRQFLLGEDEKEAFVRLMRKYEEFCGVRVLTFCVLDNHFHLLVLVPRRPPESEMPSDEELVRKVRKCQGEAAAIALEWDLKLFRESGAMEKHAKLRARWFARMWDLSAFVQSVKQRFSVWYNKRHDRKGTLWEERFRSTIVEGRGAAAAVAAYIDLNPVRAKIVADPKDYRWSGYGEAVAGRKRAIENLRIASTGLRPPNVKHVSNERVLAEYRCYIYDQGVERGVDAEGRPMKAGVSREQADAVKAAGGGLPEAALLMQRVRHFTDGAVIGSREFVNEVFGELRERFGLRRRTGPQTIREGGNGSWGGLRSLRDLDRRMSADSE